MCNHWIQVVCDSFYMRNIYFLYEIYGLGISWWDFTCGIWFFSFPLDGTKILEQIWKIYKFSRNKYWTRKQYWKLYGDLGLGYHSIGQISTLTNGYVRWYLNKRRLCSIAFVQNPKFIGQDAHDFPRIFIKLIIYYLFMFLMQIKFAN